MPIRTPYKRKKGGQIDLQKYIGPDGNTWYKFPGSSDQIARGYGIKKRKGKGVDVDNYLLKRYWKSRNGAMGATNQQESNQQSEEEQKEWQDMMNNMKPPKSDWEQFQDGLKYGAGKATEILKPIVDKIFPEASIPIDIANNLIQGNYKEAAAPIAQSAISSYMGKGINVNSHRRGCGVIDLSKIMGPRSDEAYRKTMIPYQGVLVPAKQVNGQWVPDLSD